MGNKKPQVREAYTSFERFAFWVSTDDWLNVSDLTTLIVSCTVQDTSSNSSCDIGLSYLCES